MLKEGVFLGKRYEILGRVGSGGMADVYKSKDHKLNRYVAVKVLKSDYRADEVFIQKFVSEAQAAAGLMHPNVVNVYDVGQDRGLYYMVMELVEGISLKDYIEKKGRLSAKETISISIQMVTGIQAAHQHHIVHRDIKPQNIIISKDGKVKVTDFGIARATTSTNTISTNVMGSVHYTSPEQARGGIVDEKSDIYSAGVTMYEMVTGHVPFDGESTVEVALKHLKDDVVSPAEEVPEIPYSLECIILKCMQKNQERRYHTCQELIMDLKRSLVDPDGEFVLLAGSGGTETVVMSDEELEQVQRRGYTDDEDDDYDNDFDDEDDEDDDDYDVRNRRGNGNKKNTIDPHTKKMMKILMIVAAVIIALIVIFMIGNAAGLFRGGSGGITATTEAKVTVPNVVGMTQAEAQEALKKRNLGLVVEAREASDKYAEGEVMEQTPGANEKVDKNTEIKVVISTGETEKNVSVPNVVGQDEAAAQKALEEKNLVVSAEYSYDDSVEEGKVISTDPTAGTEVKEGTKVTMKVSQGAERVDVPDLIGSYQSDAETALSNAGLTVGSVSSRYSDDYAEGVVLEQSQSAGRKVNKGTTVDFVISRGPETRTVSVPALAGYTEEQARQRLQDAGLTIGTVDSAYSTTVTAGYVINQTAASGSQVAEGTTVGFTVSLGAEPQQQQPATPEEPVESTDPPIGEGVQ